MIQHARSPRSLKSRFGIAKHGAPCLSRCGRVGRVPYRTISKRRNLLTNEIGSVTLVTSMRGLLGNLPMRWAAWRGAGPGLVFAVLLIGGCSSPEAPAPERPALRFAHNLWPGYFPITLARELGYYAREGVAVEVIYTEDQEPQIADFIAGKYDGMALPIGSLIVASGHHPDIRVVYAIDESAGGDAVVAKPAITDIAELRGKVIGATLGGFGELFVERMLEAGGLTRAEVTLINTDSNLVPEQLRAGVIDAGQAWEPYVSRVVQAGGRILYTSRETPGLIIDTLQFRAAVLRERPEDVRAFLRAILRAVEHWLAHPEEDNAIIARALAIPLGEVQPLGLKLLSLADNRRAFDRNDPTSLYQSARAYVDFYIRTGSLGRLPDLDALIDPSFLPAE